MKLLLLVMTSCLCLASALDSLQIKKITRTKTLMQDHFEIEVGNGLGDDAFDHFHLNIIADNGVSQYQDNAEDSSTSTKAVFKYDLATLGVDATVQFILTQRQDTSDNPLTFGDIKFTLPAFPSTVKPTWVGVASYYSLRISDKSTLEGFKLADKDCIKTEKSSCYFVGATKATGKVELCSKVTATMKKEFNLCDKTIDTDDVTGTVANPDATELSYTAGGAGATIIVTHPAKAIASTDVIVYMEGAEASATACASATCVFGKITLESVFNVITVGIKDDGSPLDTGYQQLTDYGVVGTPLSETLIESRWTHQTGNDQYLGTTAGGASFTETTVTCVNSEKAEVYHCFAYFTGLTKATAYPLHIQTSAASIADVKNKVTLTGTTTEGDPEVMELKFSSLKTKWNKGLRRFEINTCVHQTETSNLSTYEAILINKRGQWKKIQGVTHRIGDELCFDALHVDIYNFDLSEDVTLAVVNRGADGVTVLGTAQTTIALGALKNSSSETM